MLACTTLWASISDGDDCFPARPVRGIRSRNVMETPPESALHGAILPPSPLVTIVVNNYNYARFLAEAIDSALAQTYAALEVVVVDDGSTDESREIIAQYGGRVIPVLKDNGGQASAFNAGFAAARGM